MSPCVVLVLLVPKSDGSWRICVDNMRINHITVKYHFVIPTFRDLLDQLDSARVLSKIDLHNRYH